MARSVDRFFARVLAAQGAHMRCAPGCTACCQDDLELLRLEAEVLRDALRRLPRAARDRLAARARAGGPPCALLEEDGRCALYDARPLICRSHGLPLLYRDPDDPLQAELSCCELNFRDADPPPDAVLDATLLHATLALADRLGTDGRSHGERVSLRDVVAGLIHQALSPPWQRGSP